MTTQEIEQLERRRFAAQVSKDYATLEQLFADDLIYTHAGGNQDSKTSYLESIRTGRSRYDQVDIENLVVRLYAGGQTAVVNGLVRIDLGPGPDGQPLITRIKYVTVHAAHPAHGPQVVVWHAQKQAG